MRWVLVVALVATSACKRYVEPGAIGEECKQDRDCADALVCTKGIHAEQECMKPCGPTAMQASAPSPYDDPDQTCPAGWECKATLVYEYVDGHGQRQSSAGGLRDQRVCIPIGWRPTAR
jgi:hypothetical protein